MQFAKEISTLITLINDLECPYFLTGSVASMVYGEPRLTNDIDIVLNIDESGVLALHKTFPEDKFYLPPTDVVRVEMKRENRGHFNILCHETGMKVDVYLIGQNRLNIWGMERTRRVKAFEIELPLAPIEYVIIYKLLFFREGGSEKHIRDIRFMREVSGELINQNDLEYWLKEFSLENIWEKHF